MKIMTSMYTLRKGGAYERFLMMEEALLERQWRVHCLSLTPIQIKHPYYHNHVADLSLRIKEGFGAKLMVLFLFPLYALIIGWKEKIDLFVAFGSLYAFLQAIPKWVLGRPMITLIRGDFAFGLKVQKSSRYFIFLNRWMESLGLLFSDYIITNNTANQEEILGRLGKRKRIEVKVLFNHIPPMSIPSSEDISQTRATFGISEDAKVAVTAGILNRGKNLEILIKSLTRIGMKNLILVVAGDGSAEADFSYRNSLKKLAKKLGIDNQVIFTGWLEKEDLWKIYHASDLFILPSLKEGMPNAMLEALGSGLPCLGSNIPGIRDILQYDELMFDPRDQKALADRIQEVLCDQKILNQVKRLCQERKEIFEFDWKEKIFQMMSTGLTELAGGLYGATRTGRGNQQR